MKNDTLLLIASGTLAFFALTKKKSELYYNVPGVGAVPESALRSYGYEKINGQWYPVTAINYAVNQAGGTVGQAITQGTAIFNAVVQILEQGFSLYQKIKTITQANKQEAINQIMDKYTSVTSPDYILMFQYTSQQLQTMTIAQLQKILDTGTL